MSSSCKTVHIVQGLRVEVPDPSHCWVFDVEYRCGHTPQGKAIPDTVKVKRGDHAGPCLPFVPCLGRRRCIVSKMVHRLRHQCPMCEINDLAYEGMDVRFAHGPDA